MNNKIKILISVVLVALWACVIFVFSNTPAETSDDQSKGIVYMIAQELNIELTSDTVDALNVLLRKFAHASVYFILAIITTAAIIQLNKKTERRCYVLAVIFCFIYAITDEYHQLFVNGRSGEFRDVLIDTSGAIIGALCVWIAIKVRNKINTNKANKTLTTKNK